MTFSKEFECPICLNILYRPVTTSCGHNFCKHCIDRTLMVTQNCPICKLELSNDYSPNLLLVQIINERFPNEINERINTLMPVTNDYQDQPETVVENSNLTPVYFMKSYQPPLYDGKLRISINSEKEYRTLQSALANESRLLLCKRGFKSTFSIGTLVEINSINIGRMSDPIPLLPIYVEATFIERVKLGTPFTVSAFNFPQSTHTPYNDKWNLLSDENSQDSAKNTEIFNLLNEINDNLNKLCKNYDDINGALLDLKKLLKQMTGYNRYLCCILLINASTLLIKRQLNSGQRSLRVRFESLYGSLPILSDQNPPVIELERLSLYLAQVVLASNKLKWVWYQLDDTLERLMSIAEIIALSRERNVINLGASLFLPSIFGSMDPLVSGVIFLVLLLLAPKIYRKIIHR